MKSSQGRPWTIHNTEFSDWFECDRAHVCLTSKATGLTIFQLWDSEVSEFVDDGFKGPRQSWHEALIHYANDRGLGVIQSKEVQS